MSWFAENPGRPIEGLVRESFSALIAEWPDYYESMCGSLTDKVIEMNIDGETFCICFDEKSATFLEAIPQLVIHTGRDTILDTIDGRTSVYTALLDDRLSVKGTLDDLVELQSGLIAYLNGALRCSAFPALLNRLRALETEQMAEEIEA